MKTQIGVLIHLHKFTNIDLSTQGIYQIRVSVPGAQPYLIINSTRQEAISVNEVDENHICYPENIHHQYFYSQGFLIIYEDEEMLTNVGCAFRLEEIQLNSNIQIQMDLLFLDIKSLPDIHSQNFTQNVKHLHSKMKPISHASFQVPNPHYYNQMYYPVDFDTNHFCSVQTQIFTTPINISFTKGFVEEQIKLQFNAFINQTINVLNINRNSLLDQLLKIQSDKKIIQLSYKDQEYNIQNPDLIKQINQSFYDLHHDLYVLWCELISILKDNYLNLLTLLQQDYCEQIKQRWMNCILSYSSQNSNISSHVNQELAKNKRHSLKNTEFQRIIYTEAIIPLNSHPFFFRTTYQRQGLFQMSNDFRDHYVVLLHGYQGTSYDMRYWRAILKIRFQDKIRLILPTSNEFVNNKSIKQQAQDLADEITDYINHERVFDFKLSFVGHSLGGLVIRAALPLLKQFQIQMHSYISLGTPHCGYASSKSFIIDTGLMMIQKWNKCKTLQELSQKDNKNIGSTYLYQLSTFEGLEWFNNVVILSSHQDYYVPIQSALIQSIEETNDPKNLFYNQMVSNIQSKCRRIDRFDIDFLITKKKLDKLIGRAAHIEFIDNLLFVKMFVYLFDEFFI
ncbi:unnamed protein product (macronuclear) [Paramecium tetraurelia]|uniref:DUF676 domain-containing protein n=1 Tax=Paramecium tetraurelia TaxID=5888 RepID=A0DHH6_PARTE|nr:uncharacterized protein GSPATT00016880001 [Paramecium tetraurelia]CAK82493.1 unnamed protein product [Paramecium tetraurelia]|eukprot:XP_001449890.1 hypothetical protein (macronuclear) [Paramecium tetraurelia strain d4-2]